MHKQKFQAGADNAGEDFEALEATASSAFLLLLLLLLVQAATDKPSLWIPATRLLS
ncbi:hypothetical protein [Cohnella sp.]|uniref:hypothetical protein n=1 Tax=Cohnella sp. TaxID=1883426 RepID=UPI0035694FFB